MSAAVAAYRRQLLRTALTLVALLLVLVVATLAWFANNRQVQASNASITSETPQASLFIQRGTLDAGRAYLSADGQFAKTGLYPVSTVDCANWYRVTGWTPVADDANPLKVVQKASSYQQFAAQQLDASDIVYSFETGPGVFHGAYMKQDFTVYTDRAALDVYLNPENPITVAFDQGASAEQQERANRIKSAIRVAVTCANESGEQLVLYYVPQPENTTDVGNGLGQQAPTTAPIYYAIGPSAAAGADATAGELVQLTSGRFVLPSGLDELTAVKTDLEEDPYTTKATSLKFGRATTAGMRLTVYVWLEGTDAQTYSHITGGIADPVHVTLSFVGVQPQEQG